MDEWRWRPPHGHSDFERGSGLPLMLGLMRDVAVDPGPNGTTVRLRTPWR